MKYATLFCSILCSIHWMSALASPLNEWRAPDINNVVYLETQEGMVIIELAPFIAPKHTQRFKKLISEGFYDGLGFYRVMDGFVAQAGDIDESRKTQFSTTMDAEFTQRFSKPEGYLPIQTPDFIAPQTGYLHGFSAGHDPKSQEYWLLHCPGVVAFARNNDKDSATTEFYIVIGQATRHLDRNMTSIGRVIYGMPAVQRLQRASVNQSSGVIEETEKRSTIIRARLGKEVPLSERIQVQIQNQYAAPVTERIKDARALSNAFFHFKGNGNLDLCYYQLKTRTLTASESVK